MVERTPNLPPTIAPLPACGERPLWSVMIPCYNCSHFLEEALSSVLLQDEGPGRMQIEVVDDGSTDADVATLVRDVGKGRVAYYRQARNVGSLRNFETCISRSRGAYVHLLHGDDKVRPGFYLEVANLFRSFPDAGAAFTNCYIMGEEGTIFFPNEGLLPESGIIGDFLFRIAEKQLVQPPAMVVKRSVYETLGSFYGVHYGEDWEMWARIASRFPIAYSPETLAYYRTGRATSITGQYFQSAQNIRDIRSVINLIQSYIPEQYRNESRKKALSFYSMYGIKVANALLENDRAAAARQAYHSFKLYPGIRNSMWLLRFYLMYLLRYKDWKQGMHTTLPGKSVKAKSFF